MRPARATPSKTIIAQSKQVPNAMQCNAMQARPSANNPSNPSPAMQDPSLKKKQPQPVNALKMLQNAALRVSSSSRRSGENTELPSHRGSIELLLTNSSVVDHRRHLHIICRPLSCLVVGTEAPRPRLAVLRDRDVLVRAGRDDT